MKTRVAISLIGFLGLLGSFNYGTKAWASSLWAAGAGSASVFKRSVNDDDYNFESAGSLFIAHRWDRIEILAEATYYESTSSVGQLAVEMRHFEIMPWMRYRFLNDRSWTPYAGASLGMVKEEVDTRMGLQTLTAEGEAQWQAGLSLGLSADFWQTIRGEFDTKMLQLKDEPTLDWVFSARIGFLF